MYIHVSYLFQVRYLLEFGRRANERDEERRTPLMHCALITDEEWAVGVARTLLEYGAGVGRVDIRGLSALHYACLFGRPLLLSVFLGAIDFDLNQQDRLKNTALHYAARHGDTALGNLLIKALLKYDLSVDICNQRGETPLLLAWKSGQEDMARLLVDTGGADENVSDRQGHNVRYWQEIAKHKAEAAQHNKATVRENRKARLRQRVQSAPVHGRKSSNRNLMPSRENSQNKLYRPASASNIRNQPEQILNVSPNECFVTEEDFPLSYRRRSLDVNEAMPASWRGHFRRLFSTYDFQFSQSYRRSVTEQVIEPDPVRPGSPQPSESETISDLASISSKRSMISRRSSILSSKASSDKKKLSASGTKKRSGSFLATVCMAAIPDT